MTCCGRWNQRYPEIVLSRKGKEGKGRDEAFSGDRENQKSPKDSAERPDSLAREPQYVCHFIAGTFL